MLILTSIYLDHLRKPEEAVRIVRATQSTDGAKLVAKWAESDIFKVSSNYFA